MLATPKSVPDRAIELYTSSAWLRAAVQFIPRGFDGAIDALISTRGAALVERRITSCSTSCGKPPSDSAIRRWTALFLQTEESDDLLIRAMRTAADARDGEKIRLYA